MEPLTYQPPLRGAVLFAIRLDQGAVTVQTLAQIAQVAEDRARAFASILVARGALVEGPDGFRRGPSWEEWSTRPSRARPHRTSDRSALDHMDAMRQALAVRVKEELAARQWSARRLAREAGIHHQFVVQLVKYHIPPPACHLALLAKALGRSMDELLAA